ncbi:MAG: PAS domain S-box protein, partial [Zetaproteobacteria bacterium]
MKRLLLHGWLFILLMSAALSYTAYVYLGHLNEKFIQSEVDHRSRLLLRDIQEIIQQHLDASRGLSTYAYAELASHGGITETREAKDVLRGMLATHPGEIVRAGIIPEDGKPLIESAGDGERVPRFRVENIPEIHSGQVRLDLVENGVSGLLRVIYTPCLNQRCPRVFADVSLSVLIQRILGRSDTQHLLSGLAIKLDYTGTAEGITLFEHGSLKAATGFHWHGYFDLAGSRFLLTTAASPALVRHLSATTPQWVLALGLILGLMLALLAHDRARFGQRLREQVAMRTAALEEEREKLSAVIDYAAEAILVTDAIGRIQQANPAASRMFGYQPEEWSGLDLQVLVPENLRGQHARWMIEELANGSHGIIGHEREIEVRCKDGSLMPCSVMVSEFTAGGQRHLSVILHDLTERKRHEQQLEFLSFHDELTGLPN